MQNARDQKITRAFIFSGQNMAHDDSAALLGISFQKRAAALIKTNNMKDSERAYSRS